MMTRGLQVVLLLFAVVGFAGAGASLAVARFRMLTDGERDVGMMGVAGMLLAFGSLCAMVGVGISGVLACGAVVLWASYLFMAQNMGMLRIEVGILPAEQEPTEQRQRR